MNVVPSFHRTVVTLVNGIINPGAVGFNSEEAMAATNLSVDRHAKVRAVVLDVSEEECNFPNIFICLFSPQKTVHGKLNKYEQNASKRHILDGAYHNAFMLEKRPKKLSH